MIVVVLGLTSFLLDIGTESVIKFDRQGDWTQQLPLIYAGITGAAIPMLMRHKETKLRSLAVLLYTVVVAALLYFSYANLFLTSYDNVPLASLIFESIMGFLIPIPLFYYIAHLLLKHEY